MELDLDKLNTKEYGTLDEVTVGDIVLVDESGPEIDIVVKKDPDDDTVYLFNNGWEELPDVSHVVDKKLEKIDLDNLGLNVPIQVKVLPDAKEKTEPVFQWRDELDSIIGKKITVVKTRDDRFEIEENDEPHVWGMLTKDSIEVANTSLNAQDIYLGELQPNKSFPPSVADESTESLLKRMSLFDLITLNGGEYSFIDGTLFKFMFTPEGKHLNKLFFNDSSIDTSEEQRLQSHNLLNLIFDEDNILYTIIQDALKEIVSQAYEHAVLESPHNYAYQIAQIRLVQNIKTGEFSVLPVSTIDENVYRFAFEPKEIAEAQNKEELDWLDLDKFEKVEL